MKAMKNAKIWIVIMLIAVFSAIAVTASASGGTEPCQHVWGEIGAPEREICTLCGERLIAEFEFPTHAYSSLLEIGFPKEEIASAFPHELEFKYENGKYMIKDVGASRAMGRSGFSGVPVYLTLEDGYWIYEVSEDIYNSADVDIVVDFFGINDSWGLCYINAQVEYNALIIDNDKGDGLILMYLEAGFVEFIYGRGGIEYRDCYSENLKWQEVSFYVDQDCVSARYLSDGSFDYGYIYLSEVGNFFYYDQKGWFSTQGSENPEYACEAPPGYEDADRAYFELNTPTNINCRHLRYSEATCTAPKTCIACGETEGDALGHSFSDATCIAPKTCTVCGETEGDTLEHSFSDATCAAPKTCTVCGETEGVATVEHSFDDDGICSTCGVDSKNVLIINMEDGYGDGWNGNAIEIYADGVKVGEASFENGFQATFEYYYFEDNELELFWVSGNYSSECSYEILFGDEKAVEATVDDCEAYHDGYRIFPVCQHTFEELETIPPTCTAQGYTLYSCTVCDLTKKEDFKDSRGGHVKSEEPGVTTPPACDVSGYTTYTCAVCGETFDEDYVDSLGHTKGDVVTVKLPTCVDNGYTTYTCAVCDEEFDSDLVDRKGHVLGEEGKCSVCGEDFTLPIWIAGVIVGADNMSDVLDDGTVSYDLQTNVLTLNNFHCDLEELDDYVSAAIYSKIAINVILKGTNVINSVGMGFEFDIFGGSVTFGGDGTLTMNTDGESIYFYTEGTASLIIGGDIEIDFQPVNQEAIYILSETAGVSVTIKDNVSLTMGTEDNPLSEECIYIYCYEENEIIIKDNATVCGVNTDEEGIYISSEESSSITISDNTTVSFDVEEEALYAEKITISGGRITLVGGSEDEGIEAYEVVISGGFTSATGGSVGVDVNKMTVSGGTLKAVSVDEESTGIVVHGEFEIIGGSVSALGTTDGIYVCGELTVTAGRLEVAGGGIWIDGYDEELEEYVPGILTIGNNMHISEPVGLLVSDSLNNPDIDYLTVVGADGEKADRFVISCKHSWQEATCTALKKCTVCGAEEGSLADCTPVSDDGDCTTAVACAVCGKEVIPAHESHNDGDKNGKCDCCGIKTGLGVGAIVGIAVGSTVAAGAGGFSLWWFVFRKKRII